jgi:hypothetical protein
MQTLERGPPSSGAEILMIMLTYYHKIIQTNNSKINQFDKNDKPLSAFCKIFVLLFIKQMVKKREGSLQQL